MGGHGCVQMVRGRQGSRPKGGLGLGGTGEQRCRLRPAGRLNSRRRPKHLANTRCPNTRGKNAARRQARVAAAPLAACCACSLSYAVSAPALDGASQPLTPRSSGYPGRLGVAVSAVAPAVVWQPKLKLILRASCKSAWWPAESVDCQHSLPGNAAVADMCKLWRGPVSWGSMSAAL